MWVRSVMSSARRGLCIALIGAACSHSVRGSPSPQVRDADPAGFRLAATTALRDLRSGTGTGALPIRADPRPIWTSRQRAMVDSSSLEVVNGDLLRRREAVLDSLSIERVDATIARFGPSCPGPLAADGSDSSVHQGCPRESFVAIAMSTVRSGSPDVPADMIYDRDREVAAAGYWTIRITSTRLGPHGAILRAFDLVIRERGGRWESVRLVPLFILE